jgi:hypothetical protein
MKITDYNVECLSNDDAPIQFTEGKIYEVRNGDFTDDTSTTIHSCDLKTLVAIVPGKWKVTVLKVDGAWYDISTIINTNPVGTVNLNTCENGDILIGSHGAILEYVGRTTSDQYLDHVVHYITNSNGFRYSVDNIGTRTNDGFVFKNNRIPETDEDIVQIIKVPHAI